MPSPRGQNREDLAALSALVFINYLDKITKLQKEYDSSCKTLCERVAVQKLENLLILCEQADKLIEIIQK